MMKEIKTTFYILDIETKPQEDLVNIVVEGIKANGVLKDPEKIKADIEYKKSVIKKTMSTDTDLADIICIGIKKVGDYEPILLNIKEFEGFIKENPLAIFVTFNGKKFDIPLLIKQGIKNNLDLPYQRLKEMCKKWQNIGHYDLMEIICDGDYKSLDLLLQIYCGVKKTPINFETASEDEIKKHCLEDLKNTELLCKKFINIL